MYTIWHWLDPESVGICSSGIWSGRQQREDTITTAASRSSNDG